MASTWMGHVSPAMYYSMSLECFIIDTYSIVKLLKPSNTPTKLPSRLLNLIFRQFTLFKQSQVGSICSQALSVDFRLSHPRLLAFDARVVLLYSTEKLIVGWEKGPESCGASGTNNTSVPVDESAVDVEGERFDGGPVDGGGLGHDG